jgi:hypothetical protein
LFKSNNGEVGIELLQHGFCRAYLGHADRGLAVHDLALEIGEIHHIMINQGDLAYTSCCQVWCGS